MADSADTYRYLRDQRKVKSAISAEHKDRVSRILRQYPDKKSDGLFKDEAPLDRNQIRDYRPKRSFVPTRSPMAVSPRRRAPAPQTGPRAPRAVRPMTAEQRARNERSDPVGTFLGNVAKTVGSNVASNVPGTPQWDKRRKRENALAASHMRGEIKLGDIPRNDMALSPGAIGKIIQIGNTMLRSKTPLLTEGGRSPELERMVSGLTKIERGSGRPGRAYQLPRRSERPTIDVGFDYRIPMLTARKGGQVYMGRSGDVHGQLADELAELGSIRTSGRGLGPGGLNRSEILKDYIQGWIIHPDRDLLRIETGWGRDWGLQPPDNTRGMEQLIRWLTPNYDDADLLGRVRFADPVTPKSEGLERLARAMDEDFYQQFLSKERIRRRRRGSSR